LSISSIVDNPSPGRPDSLFKTKTVSGAIRDLYKATLLALETEPSFLHRRSREFRRYHRT
jgi:hypothetical protein